MADGGIFPARNRGPEQDTLAKLDHVGPSATRECLPGVPCQFSADTPPLMSEHASDPGGPLWIDVFVGHIMSLCRWSGACSRRSGGVSAENWHGTPGKHSRVADGPTWSSFARVSCSGPRLRAGKMPPSAMGSPRRACCGLSNCWCKIAAYPKQRRRNWKRLC